MSDEQRKQKSFSNEHNKPHVTKHVRFDGRMVTLATLETQTDWNWLERTKLQGIFKVYITDVDADLNHSLPERKDSTGTPRPGFKTSKPNEEDSIAEEAGSSEIETPVKVLSKCDTKDKNKDSKKFNRPLVDSARSDCTLDVSGQFSGVFIGICEFCGQVIKPFPSLEDKILMSPEELYCCLEYQDFVEFAMSTAVTLEKENKNMDLMINVKPHEHVDTKLERKAAKERAAQRLQDQELQTKQKETSGIQGQFLALMDSRMAKAKLSKLPGKQKSSITTYDTTSVPAKSATEGLSNRIKSPAVESKQSQVKNILLNKYGKYCLAKVARAVRVYLLMMKNWKGVARQMKVINYQLSSLRFLYDGWTIKDPLLWLPEDKNVVVFIPEPLDLEILKDEKLLDCPLIEQFYEDGQKFLTIFPDGTGNVFYPSGKLAILISSVKLGQYYYTINLDHDMGLAASFEPDGHGFCYFPNGDIRLYIDQYGGIVHYKDNGKRCKWSWIDQVTHVHAPPFQPICIHLNKFIDIRLISQDVICINFGATCRGCRFNMGSRLKQVAPLKSPPKEIENDRMYLKKMKKQLNYLLNIVHKLAKHSNSAPPEIVLPPTDDRTEKIKMEVKRSRQYYLMQQSTQ